MKRPLALGLSFGAATMGAGWYFSGLLRERALVNRHGPPRFDLEVVSLVDDGIELRPLRRTRRGDWLHEGRFGLHWDAGRGFAGKIVELDAYRVVREFEPSGAAPVPGTLARLDSFHFPDDPMEAHRIPFEEVQVPGELGDMPAWQVAGDRRTWAIFVHGKGATRREALRMLPAVVATGRTALVITYRNDEGAPASPRRQLEFGVSEWRDLEAAVAYAESRGAENIVLAGFSMGGGICLNFMDKSAKAGLVRGLILDAPMLSFAAAVEFQARSVGVAKPLVALGRPFARWRFGVDWEATDYRNAAAAIEAPTLLFHGTADPEVPIALSDWWAASRPDVVRYQRVDGAAHVRSWNVDPDRYSAAVREFLETLDRG